MVVILGYLLLFLVALAIGAVVLLHGVLSPEFGSLSLPLLCGAVGGVGGCVYCLRGIYIHKCVEKNWSRDWYVWYFLRPIVSTICGGVSYLFLKAGLLILESKQEMGATQLGFLALAFIAGLNVDKFIAKIEDVAQAVWGIEKSRASKGPQTKD